MSSGPTSFSSSCSLAQALLLLRGSVISFSLTLQINSDYISFLLLGLYKFLHACPVLHLPSVHSISNFLGRLNNHSSCSQTVKSCQEENYFLSSSTSNFCYVLSHSTLPECQINFQSKFNVPLSVLTVSVSSSHSFLTSRFHLVISNDIKLRNLKPSKKKKETSLSPTYSCRCPPSFPYSK